MKTALQRGDAALPLAQELFELIEQRPEDFEDAIVIFDFMIEVEAPHVTLAPREPPPWIGAPPQQAIEIRQRCRTETPGKPGARQAQQLAERAHAHGQQPRIGFFGPAQDADRQWFEPRRQLARIGDEAACAGSRGHQRRQRRGRQREMRLRAAACKSRIRETRRAQLAAQLFQAPEQTDARLDFEQQAVGRFDGHLRRERGRDAGQPLHERQFTRRIARPGVDIRRGRERRAQASCRDVLPLPAPWHPRRRCADCDRFIEHHERRSGRTRR